MLPLTIKNIPFKIGQTLTVKGVADAHSTNFEVNICPDESDVALHINPRFKRHTDVNTVVCDYLQGGQWLNRVTTEEFPFQQGAEFTITVAFSPGEFLVTFADATTIHYPNHLGAFKYRILSFQGEASFTSVEIK
ncbi:beta-galactoside-binding lectin-like [Synchiropus splendidus]|uniref:beta-galactoside-binding lectin-like n=1 Tax=Synchiropus splendidus TaxID=270530 RepID=UPI00237ED14B|nr:beta-galactoside-binding lectin-like [Synchiropus splendidus]